MHEERREEAYSSHDSPSRDSSTESAPPEIIRLILFVFGLLLIPVVLFVLFRILRYYEFTSGHIIVYYLRRWFPLVVLIVSAAFFWYRTRHLLASFVTGLASALSVFLYFWIGLGVIPPYSLVLILFLPILTAWSFHQIRTAAGDYLDDKAENVFRSIRNIIVWICFLILGVLWVAVLYNLNGVGRSILISLFTVVVLCVAAAGMCAAVSAFVSSLERKQTSDGLTESERSRKAKKALVCYFIVCAVLILIGNRFFRGAFVFFVNYVR